MSLISLPPAWQPWTKQDLEDLTLEEIELLFASLTKKIYDLENQFLEETAFYKRNRVKIERKEQFRKELERRLANSKP